MEQGLAVDSNPVATEAAPTGQAEAANGTVEGQNGQAATQAQSAPAEESFSNVDPNTLPPELQAVYKNLQADYTRKTQSVAEIKKKAESYDKLIQDQKYKDYLGNLSKEQKAEFKEQKAQAEKRLGEKISDEEFAKAFNSKDEFLSFLERVVQDRTEPLKQQNQKLEMALSEKDAADLVEAFATEIGEDSKPIRPDFYTLDEDQLITGYLRINPPQSGDRQARVEKLNEAYTWAKSVSQKYYEKGRADALARIQQKVATSTNPPTGASKGAYSGVDPKKLSVREAMDLARKGIRVPQDY